jgi:hypothetical protein
MRKVDRECDADGQHIPARDGQHTVNLIGYWFRHFDWPSIEQELRRMVGQFLRPKEARERGHHD